MKSRIKSKDALVEITEFSRIAIFNLLGIKLNDSVIDPSFKDSFILCHFENNFKNLNSFRLAWA